MANTLSRPVFAVFNVLYSDAPLVELTYPKSCPEGAENPWQMSSYEDQKCKNAGKKFTRRQHQKISNEFLCWHHLAVFSKEKTKNKQTKNKKKHVIHRPPGRSCRLVREFHSYRIFYAKLSEYNKGEYNKGHRISYRSTCISLPTSKQIKCYNLLNKSKCKNLCSIYNKIWVQHFIVIYRNNLL